MTVKQHTFKEIMLNIAKARHVGDDEDGNERRVRYWDRSERQSQEKSQRMAVIKDCQTEKSNMLGECKQKQAGILK